MGILIRDLTKSFGDKKIFDGLSADIPDRGLVRVVGVSGVGKTTLLRMIAGLDTDYSGSISGVGSVAFAFQEYRLFPWLSAISNITVASFSETDEQARESAERELSALGFTRAEMLLKPPQLSGGMKQRVSLARAFLKNSDVLLLDEPTKELDTGLIGTVADMIVSAAKRRTVFLVTHDAALDHLKADLTIDVKKI